MIGLFSMGLEPSLQADIEAGVLETLRAGAFILGERVERFEREIAAAYGVPHAVGVASGTDALVLSLRALGIGAGDEVIVPALSFYASAEAVLLVGATPVLVDVEPQTLTLSLEAAAQAVTERTKAIMPVHLYGNPADMPAIMKLAETHGLKVIEDAAQAIGASIGGRFVGQWGDACCYSFYPTKNLGAAGDAGMVTTPHADLAARVRLLRVHGTTRPYYHEEVGYTSRLDALQAVVLSAKLPYLEGWNDRRREIAKAYDSAFSGLAGVRTLEYHDGNVYHLYNLLVSERDGFIERLKAEGIESRPYYPHALPDLPPLKPHVRHETPCAHAAALSILALPTHPYLMEAEQERVIAAVLKVAKAL